MVTRGEAGSRRCKAAALGAVGGLALLSAVPAHAEGGEQNAATQSSDAFGHTVGNERSGLYGADDVRGFNPGEAGNNRLDGLYFDFVGFVSSRLIEGNTVRVGLAVQRFPFPAPSGLVDYELKVPHENGALRLEVDTAGSSAPGPGAVVEARLPIDGGRWGIALGASYRDAGRPEGGGQQFHTLSALVRYRPAAGTEFTLFASTSHTRGFEARATYFPAGTTPPPQIERGRFLGLDWASSDSHNQTHGALAKVALGGGWRLHAGLFIANRQQDSAFADLLLGVTPEGRASRVVIADPGPQDSILSGELRLIREWRAGALSHSLTASLRGRRKNRLFGGSEIVRLGSGPIDDPAAWPARAPAFAYRPQDEDRVRQLAAGLSYNLLWHGRASLDVGVSQGFYRKTIDFADPRLADALSRDRPLLWNISASVSLSDRLIAFAGLSRGQEDAVIAPDVAVNRAEAPPAIRTRQVEAGLRFALAERLALVVGAFEIARPYYNLDPGLRYRRLGRLTNRGLEFSLTGQVVPGLSVVGGLLLADPKISGEAVASGLIGQRPVGQVRRRLASNIDWRSQGGKGPLSLDLYIESFSSRVGNAANTLVAPPRTQVNLGARYRFNLAGARVILRPQVVNLFNAYGWQVSSSGGFTYTTGRFGSLSLTADW